MSYELYITRDNKNNEWEIAQVEPHQEGGTIALGGTSDANLNITYNYYEVFDMKILNGKTCKDCIEWLEQIVNILGTEQHEDYWNVTNGNVGYCLSVILSWCKQHPNGTIAIH